MFESEEMAWGISEYLKFYHSKYKKGFNADLNNYRVRIHLEENEMPVLGEHALYSTKLHSVHELTRRNVNTVRKFQNKCKVPKEERMSSYGMSKKDLVHIDREFNVDQYLKLHNILKGRRVDSVEKSLDVYFGNAISIGNFEEFQLGKESSSVYSLI